MKLYEDLMKQPVEPRTDNNPSFAKYHEAVVLTK